MGHVRIGWPGVSKLGETLPGSWRYRVMLVQVGPVSARWDEIASLTCNFYLQRAIVSARSDPVMHSPCCRDILQPNKQQQADLLSPSLSLTASLAKWLRCPPLWPSGYGVLLFGQVVTVSSSLAKWLRCPPLWPSG